MEENMKLIRFVATALVFCFIMFGCAKSSPDAYSLLCKLLSFSGEDTDGSGYIYSSSADTSSVEYLSPQTLERLFGEVYAENIAPLVEECAVFLSSRGGGEMAVFKCYSRSDADTVSKMLLERADTLKVGLRNTQWEEKSRGIEIKIKGNYLLFCFVENVEQTVSEFLELI